MEMSEAQQLREHIAELRRMARQTANVERQQKLLDLATRWEEFVGELGRPSAALSAHATERAR